MTNTAARCSLLGIALAVSAAVSADAVRGAEPGPAPDANVILRGNLDNCRIRFERSRQGRVAFMGGSITEMNGYRPMVCEILKRRFPKTEFTFIDAGIASTCSTTGAFRLQSDVLENPALKGKPVDLFFVEFAVNDDQDAGHARRECIRGMEGIVRHCRRSHPAMDIVIVYFVNPGMLETIQAGKTPLPVAAHEEVARHYGVSSIYLAREVAERIAAGALTWKEFGGTHPAPEGNAICAGMIDRLMGRAWAQPLAVDAAEKPHAIPEPLDPLSYFRGRFVNPKEADAGEGWTLGVPDWDKLKGGKRGRFTSIPLLCGETPGAELTLEFTGTAVGAYVLAGPDAGVVEATVDGGPARRVDLYHRFSANLHYPRTVMFATELEPGQHTLELRIDGKSTSGGHAVRIVRFGVN